MKKFFLIFLLSACQVSESDNSAEMLNYAAINNPEIANKTEFKHVFEKCNTMVKRMGYASAPTVNEIAREHGLTKVEKTDTRKSVYPLVTKHCRTIYSDAPLKGEQEAK